MPWNASTRIDLRLDAIAPEATSDDFQIQVDDYDHHDAHRDLNCVFPIDRLRLSRNSCATRSAAPADALVDLRCAWGERFGCIVDGMADALKPA